MKKLAANQVGIKIITAISHAINWDISDLVKFKKIIEQINGEAEKVTEIKKELIKKHGGKIEANQVKFETDEDEIKFHQEIGKQIEEYQKEELKIPDENKIQVEERKLKDIAKAFTDSDLSSVETLDIYKGIMDIFELEKEE